MLPQLLPIPAPLDSFYKSPLRIAERLRAMRVDIKHACDKEGLTYATLCYKAKMKPTRFINAFFEGKSTLEDIAKIEVALGYPLWTVADIINGPV